MSKKLSVVTVTYNIITNSQQDFFKQMFESVQNQTYQNIEHVIIDGGSEDGSVEYIRSLILNAKKEVKFFSEPDSGIYNAMNKGIKKSSGDYIAFMNSDDYYFKDNALESLYNGIVKNNCDFSCADAVIFLKNNKIRFMKADIDSCFYRMPFCHQTMLCKKELFYQYGLFDESFKIAADYDFILKLVCNKHKGQEIAEDLVFFRYSGFSYQNRNQTLEEAGKVLFKHYDENIFNLEDCKKIFSSELPLQILIKILKAHLKIKEKKINYSKIFFILAAKVSLQRIKNLIRFRFLIKKIEPYFR